MEKLLLRYAKDLNDAYPGHEFSIWSADDLLEYFNEALCILSAQRPDLFAELKIVKVEPCSTFLDICDCNKILDVLGQSDKNGRIIGKLTRRLEDAENAWTGRVRRAKSFSKALEEYEIVEDTNLVRVYPEDLDPDKDYYVLIRCSVDAETYTMDSAPPDTRCAFLAAARHYVLFCAKMRDGEFSADIRLAADAHLKMFEKIIGYTKEADEAEDIDYKNKYEQARDARRGR